MKFIQDAKGRLKIVKKINYIKITPEITDKMIAEEEDEELKALLIELKETEGEIKKLEPE